MYHYVHDGPPAVDCSRPHRGGIKGLSSAAFNAQLDQLCRALEPIDWPLLYAWTRGRSAIPQRSFLLTFDDGLIDHSRTVVPILQERGLRGVFFVPGAVLASHHMLPAHALHLVLSRLAEEEIVNELCRELEHHQAGRPWVARLRTLDRDAAVNDRAAAMYHYESPLRAALKYFLTMLLPPDLRNLAVTTVFERHVGSSVRWARHWYLGWDDLVHMQSLGHTVGGHGFSHEPYARLSADQQRHDVARVSAVLREGLGADLRPFSFPYGSTVEGAAELFTDSGFVHAFGTERSWLTSACDLHGLPRLDTIAVDAFLHEESPCPPA